MRFGKKSRNLAAASRRIFGERPQHDQQAAGLATETLESTGYEENAMTPPPPEESMVAGDPTQRLLTALGRFQRQVARAEEGTPQDAWCDECMNQLITGIEIALNEDWADVKEALTDAARILQTYEDAGRADKCVRFLKDSYEILCLMVGDLIVGNVRSGVMKKWHDRYERALDELADAGLTLVDDDGPAEREAPRGAQSDTAERPQTRDDFDALLDRDETAPESIFDGEPAGTASGRAFASDPDDPFAPLDADFQDPNARAPFAGTESLHQPAVNPSELPSLDELLGRPVSADDDLDEGERPAPELSDDFTADHGDSDAAVEMEAETVLLDEEETESVYEEEPVDEKAIPETAFSGLDDTAEPPALDEAPARPVPEPVAVAAVAAPPVPEPEPAPGTPEALLRTAQRAMAAGNVADAKVFALQLAANMAKLEADQVQARIEVIESDIESNSSAVTAGELAVNEAEDRVRTLEEAVSRCQQEVEEKVQQIGSIREEVASVESTVADLNRQIAELEARRDAEAERLAHCQANLEDSVNEEERMRAELESLKEEESGSRENLDGAREHVRSLQDAGAACAANLAATQTELERRRRAVDDIENTIRHVSGEPEEAPAAPAPAQAPPAVPEQTELLADSAGGKPDEHSGEADSDQPSE